MRLLQLLKLFNLTKSPMGTKEIKMSRLLTVAAIAAVTTVTAVAAYVTYRVKSGKTKMSVTIKNTDSATETSESTAPATEAVDPLVAALRAQLQREIQEAVEFLKVTKPRLFEGVEVAYDGGTVILTKDECRVALKEIALPRTIEAALEELQAASESEE